MALMDEANRAAVWTDVMRDAECPGSLTKPQLRAAIDAIDDWIDANAASLNSALPVAARNNLTARQKRHLFLFVAMRRLGAG